jgi:hypothetical protein
MATRSRADLRALWDERDRRYASGRSLEVTDGQVDAIRVHRLAEALDIRADLMAEEARRWEPPKVTLSGVRR